MNEFEMFFYTLLILLFAVVFYLAGKGDLFNLIPLMLADKTNELQKRLEKTNMVRCEKCGAELDSLFVGVFNYDGSDSEYKMPITEYEEDAVTIETNQNWVGYGLTEEEQRENICCPYCKQFPFKNGEIQSYEIVRVVCFKSEEKE